MRFGVVACPKCRRVQSVELRFQRTTCRSCRASLETATLRFFHRGDDESAAREAAQRVSAQLAGMGIEEYARMLERIELDRRGTVDDVVSVLAPRGEFGREEFEAEVRRLRVSGDSEGLLGRLSLENRIYEPKPGRFRFV